MNKVIDWIKSHPWEAGGAALIGLIFFLFIMRGSGSSSNAGPDANLSSYLQAETAQSEYSDALQATQSTNAAGVQAASIAAAEQIDVNNTWAASDLATSENNNVTSTQNNLISQIGSVANKLGTVLTNSTSSGSASSSGGSSFLWGLFGSGPSASQSESSTQHQSFVANSQQAAAEAELEQIANTQFHVGN